MAKIRKRRQSAAKSKALPEPGCAVLPEDQRWINSRSSLRCQPRRRPAPPIVTTEKVCRSEVERRLITAMKTLRAVPDRERRFFAVKSSSPEYIQDCINQYDPDDDRPDRYQPTPADISDYLTALSWVRHLDKSDWKILWWRSFDMSFGIIGKKIGRSDETARRYFDRAVLDAWVAANGQRQIH